MKIYSQTDHPYHSSAAADSAIIILVTFLCAVASGIAGYLMHTDFPATVETPYAMHQLTPGE